jgi:MSHA biogenesis protein MshP
MSLNQMSLNHTASLHRQKGSATMVAVIISLVLLSIGIALSNQISSNARQQSIEYYGARAYLSAQSGLEVAISRLVNNNNPNCSVIEAPVNIAADALSNCTVTLSCDVETNVDEPEVSAGAIRVYLLESLSQCSAGQLSTSRRVLVEVRQEE